MAQAPFDADAVVKAAVYSKKAAVRLPGGRTMVQVLAGDDSASPLAHLVQHPLHGRQAGGGRGILLRGPGAGHLDPARDRKLTVRACRQVARTPLVAVYPQTEGPGQRPDRPLWWLAPGGADPARAPAFRPARKIQAARQVGGRPGHPLPEAPEAAAAIAGGSPLRSCSPCSWALILLRSRGAARAGAPMRGWTWPPSGPACPSPPPPPSAGPPPRSVPTWPAPPLNRLLQGDVGSGKTLVAAAGVYMAHQNGYQSALMAPHRDPLAAQHADTLEKLLGPPGVRVALLTGGMKAAASAPPWPPLRRARRTLWWALMRCSAPGWSLPAWALPWSTSSTGLRCASGPGWPARPKAPRAGHERHPHPPHLGPFCFTAIWISPSWTNCPRPQAGQNPGGAGSAAPCTALNAQIEAGRQVYIVCPRVEEAGRRPGRAERGQDLL